MIDAKKREIENMEIHGVYECLPDIGQEWISTRWVITEKSKDNKIMKVCLVAHGYEDLYNLKTDSLTCIYEDMCLVMLTAPVIKWQVETWFHRNVSAGWYAEKRDIS